ncbi:KAP family NTPase [Bacillus altitudinis]|uniref:hypothetical protein n=1 Tax=Bacillus altitudinis TaxID=293387 RepID=UPI0022DE756E|nr:hypothetical protein [Bacillus altitudinis]WBL50340.1 KAP family NTPase [Bacillus altitudinis]
MNAGKIVKILEELRELEYKKLLIDGEWGIGKTKYVNDFIKSNPEQSCCISLFGKKNLKNIIDEIYFKLLQGDANGKVAKHLKKSVDKVIDAGVNISFLGLSFSIPLLGDLYSQMFKELKEKNSYILIFDDLERKHDELNLKEFLGLIDSLTAIEGIKIVLVASTKNFDGVSKSVISEYNEKSIDRTYIIKKYADLAPHSILGTDQWHAIKKIALSIKLNNLRTFQKSKQFTAEVMNKFNEDIFTEKFTLDDLRRLCFATVAFYTSLRHIEQISLKTKKEKMEYLGNLIKNSFDNVLSIKLLNHILKWYESGEYKIEDIINEINFINNYSDRPLNILSSVEELEAAKLETERFLKELKGDETIESVIQAIEKGRTCSDMLSSSFNLNEGELLGNLRTNILQHINIENNVEENARYSTQFISLYDEDEDEISHDIIEKINKEIEYEYYNKLADEIILYFKKQNFSGYKYLLRFKGLVDKIKDERVRSNLKIKLEQNNFFFPMPKGKITIRHWDWCSEVFVLIQNIGYYWGIDHYFEDFKTVLMNDANKIQDQMLHYRIKELTNGNF